MRNADDEGRFRSTREAAIHRPLAAPATVVDADDLGTPPELKSRMEAGESVVDKLARLANRPSQRTGGPDFEM